MNTATPSTQDEATTRHIGYFMLVFGFIILTLSFLSSCNTTRGFGRDVQQVGGKIEAAAERTMN